MDWESLKANIEIYENRYGGTKKKYPLEADFSSCWVPITEKRGYFFTIIFTIGLTLETSFRNYRKMFQSDYQKLLREKFFFNFTPVFMSVFVYVATENKLAKWSRIFTDALEEMFVTWWRWVSLIVIESMKINAIKSCASL